MENLVIFTLIVVLVANRKVSTVDSLYSHYEDSFLEELLYVCAGRCGSATVALRIHSAHRSQTSLS